MNMWNRLDRMESVKFIYDFYLWYVGNLERMVGTVFKAKRRYLLTCEVSRYCLLALHGSMRGTDGGNGFQYVPTDANK